LEIKYILHLSYFIWIIFIEQNINIIWTKCQRSLEVKWMKNWFSKSKVQSKLRFDASSLILLFEISLLGNFIVFIGALDWALDGVFVRIITTVKFDGLSFLNNKAQVFIKWLLHEFFFHLYQILLFFDKLVLNLSICERLVSIFFHLKVS